MVNHHARMAPRAPVALLLVAASLIVACTNAAPNPSPTSGPAASVVPSVSPGTSTPGPTPQATPEATPGSSPVGTPVAGKVEHPTDPKAQGGAPSGTPDISFYCDDIATTVTELKAKGVVFTHPVENHGYGLVTHFEAPGGFTLQLYQPLYGKGDR